MERWSNKETYYGLSDGAAFGRIAREIPKVGPNLLPRSKLRTILEGPLFPSEEQPGDESVNARNVFTELELAADFSEKGIQPTGFDDLQFEFESVRFSVQCKRLHSPRRIEDNILSAYAQLQRNLATDQDRGFIGLSVERVLGIDDKILRLEPGHDLSAIVSDLINEFRRAHQSIWLNFIDTRVVGILVIVRFLCYTVVQDVVGPAYYLGFANLTSPEAFQASELYRLQRLVAYLTAGIVEGTEPLPSR